MDDEHKEHINIFKPVDKSLTNDDQEVPTINQQTSSNPGKLLLNWRAAESFSTSKNFQWYLILTIGTIAFATAIYFFTGDKITTSVILIGGILIGIYGAKKPKVFQYQLTENGLNINGRYYRFDSFRSFSVVSHGGAHSIVLTPMKRFIPYLYMYYGSDVEEKLTTTLSNALPRQTSHNDLIDKVLRNIGF